MGYYVYRFLNEMHQVIYVGRTTNLLSRMNGHFRDSGHLPATCYAQVRRIDYLQLRSGSDMKIKELVYISKYKPAFNTKDVDDVSFQFNEIDDVWVTFDRKKEKKLLDNYNLLSNLVATYHEKNEKLSEENEVLKENVAELENQVMDLGNQSVHKHVFELSNFIASDVSYKKAMATLRANPEKAFVNLVDGEIQMEMFVHNEEIICRLYRQYDDQFMPPGQEHFTIILDSPYEERKRTVLEEKRELPVIELVYTVTLCNNWLESSYAEMDMDGISLTQRL